VNAATNIRNRGLDKACQLGSYTAAWAG
jgi:hypothetical protein